MPITAEINIPSCTACGRDIATEIIGETVLSADYWDCDCLSDFIHPKSLKSCGRCGADLELHIMPDSRLNEIEQLVAGPRCRDCQ